MIFLVPNNFSIWYFTNILAFIISRLFSRLNTLLRFLRWVYSLRFLSLFTKFAFSACVLSHFRCVSFNALDYSSPDSSVSWDSPGKNTGVGCQTLLQQIFLTCNAGRCFTTEPPGKPFHSLILSNRKPIVYFQDLGQASSPNNFLTPKDWTEYPFTLSSLNL